MTLIIHCSVNAINSGYDAVTDDYDGGDIDYDRRSNDPIGHGKTKWDAIRDLLEQLEERE